AVRWMDDLWIFANSKQRLARLVEDVEALLDDQGLSLNAEKTVLVDTDEFAEASDVSLVVSGRAQVSEAATTRDDILDKILADADDVSRSNINLLAKSFSRSDGTPDPAKVTAMLSNLDRLEHAADYVANFIRVADKWVDKLDWYIAHVERHRS